MNQMRDRLIKLIDESPPEFVSGSEGVADFLLANGVIVPPCKAGDTIYMVTPGGKIHKKKVLGATMEVGLNLYDEIWERCTFVCESALVFKDLDIGKTVFLTREEAEQALTGGDETNG